MKPYYVSAAAAALVLACSGSSKTDIPTSDTSPTTPAPTATTPKTTPPAAPPAAPPAPPPAPTKTGECASTTDKTSCSQCCAKAHQDGASVYIGAVMDCMCQADKCAKECADTLCDPQNPRDPDSQCNACIQQKNTQCANDIQNACAGDPDCQAFDQCIGDSGCLSK